jgi:hypothetical protein
VRDFYFSQRSAKRIARKEREVLSVKPVSRTYPSLRELGVKFSSRTLREIPLCVLCVKFPLRTLREASLNVIRMIFQS